MQSVSSLSESIILNISTQKSGKTIQPAKLNQGIANNRNNRIENLWQCQKLIAKLTVVFFNWS